jgi:hypothetical protein
MIARKFLELKICLLNMDPTTGQDKVYTAETIQDNPFPAQPDQTTVTDQQATASGVGGSASQSNAATIPEQTFPALKIANELLSSSLNTRTKKIIQEFAFTPSGAIQIGNFLAGISGDVRISPEGIIGRNMLGDTTFALDSETGDAVFAGIIQGLSLIAGLVNLGDGSIQIDGINRRMLFFDDNGVPIIVIGNV